MTYSNNLILTETHFKMGNSTINPVPLGIQIISFVTANDYILHLFKNPKFHYTSLTMDMQPLFITSTTVTFTD